MKRFYTIFIRSIILLYFPVMLGLVAHHQTEVVCADLKLEVKDSMQIRFVSDEKIRKAILGRFDETLGTPLKSLNFERIENFVVEHPAVKECEVYNTIGGRLKIDLFQHMPLFRVFENERTYYIDENGNEMPVFDHYSARVLIVSGAISGEKEHLIKMARFFRDNPFWKAQIEQIYVKDNGDYVLVPRVGDHLILFGPPERIRQKMRNLKALYKKGMEPREWNQYQVINLKYEGQVLCSKNRKI